MPLTDSTTAIIMEISVPGREIPQVVLEGSLVMSGGKAGLMHNMNIPEEVVATGI